MPDISEMMEEWWKDLRAKRLDALEKNLERTGCLVDRETNTVIWPFQRRRR